VGQGELLLMILARCSREHQSESRVMFGVREHQSNSQESSIKVRKHQSEGRVMFVMTVYRYWIER
jgi:hypothetical protein